MMKGSVRIAAIWSAKFGCGGGHRRYARTGQWAIVYFISDLDPSGLDLQRAWEEALANFGVRVSEFVRIGLTREQVDDLDSARLREGIAVKPSDSRAKRFIEQYGERCWETDILPAAIIEQALDDHVRSWLDGKLRQRRTAEIERARAPAVARPMAALVRMPTKRASRESASAGVVLPRQNSPVRQGLWRG
jgi:hypothetical protein